MTATARVTNANTATAVDLRELILQLEYDTCVGLELLVVQEDQTLERGDLAEQGLLERVIGLCKLHKRIHGVLFELHCGVLASDENCCSGWGQGTRGLCHHCRRRRGRSR